MPQKQNTNLDEDLRQRVGHDATSSFESDPRFTDSDPTANAGSENIGATASASGDRLSGNTDRRSNRMENDEGPSLEEEDESTVDSDTGYDTLGLTPEAEDEDTNHGVMSESGESADITAIDEDSEVSQDETRLEGGAQSARGRGSRKTPRQAA